MDNLKPSPLISILLVSWNSAKHIPHCLENLVKQSFKDFEIIVIDNGSTDNGVANLEEKYPTLNLSVKKLETNQGFAVANNIGAALARGKWLALLNADAFPEPNWLEELVKAADHHPEFNFFASRQIKANSNPELLDGIGDVYHISGLAWRQGYNQPAYGAGLLSREVFSACGAAALYLREKFLEAGGFDADYFSYFEDVELSFRLRLMGGRCLYVPTAVVYHLGSASTGVSSDFAVYHGHRNLVWTYFKDMPLALFWFYLPLHVAVNIYLSLAFLIRDKRSILLKSKIDALWGLPAILSKRKHVQQLRSVSTAEIYRILNRELFAPHRASRARTKLD